MPARIATAPTLALVVPTYNERDRLPELVRAIFAAYDSAGIHGELVIVDDNSPDGTGQVADELAAASLPIRVVHRAGKLGLGTAVVEGFAAAEAEIVGVIDADLSHPPELVPRMLAVMQEREGGHRDRQPLHSRRRHRELGDVARADVEVRVPDGARARRRCATRRPGSS